LFRSYACRRSGDQFQWLGIVLGRRSRVEIAPGTIASFNPSDNPTGGHRSPRIESCFVQGRNYMELPRRNVVAGGRRRCDGLRRRRCDGCRSCRLRRRLRCCLRRGLRHRLIVGVWLWRLDRRKQIVPKDQHCCRSHQSHDESLLLFHSKSFGVPPLGGSSPLAHNSRLKAVLQTHFTGS